MKILLVASKWSPEYSGPGVRIPRLYNAIADKIDATQIQVLCGSTEFFKNEVYNHQGFEVRRIVCPYVRRKRFPFNVFPPRIYEAVNSLIDNLIGLWALRQYRGIDLVHVIGTSGVTAAALFCARWHKIPVIQELVTAKASPEQRFLMFFKVRPPKNSVIITMRNDVRNRSIKAGFKGQIWHRPNPFDQDKFSLVSEDEKMILRESVSPFGRGDIVLCSVAKIIPQKNQIFLIDVMRELEERYKLIIAGPAVTQGPLYERDMQYLESIRRLIQEYGLEHRVYIHTEYVKSEIYMKSSDVYMLPAYDEGFGTPMMEAIACGVPVIANKDELAFSEWLEEGQNGFLRPLVAKEWALACGLAVSASMEKRQTEAEKIINLAGQSHIHAQYIEKIKGLTGVKDKR